MEEFLRRRTRLQRVEEAVRRNTVIGFFDTLYWSRQFRRRLESRKSARMNTVPEFSVPEILVDAQEDGNEEEQVKDMTSGASSPLASPKSPDFPGSSSSPGKGKPSLHIDTSGTERGSAGSSPTEWERVLSPRRLRDADTEYHGAAGQLSPAGSPSPSGHDHDTSEVSVQDMMQSLGDSAWGESIRRSFTQRRPQN